jgi:hypothetical protein
VNRLQAVTRIRQCARYDYAHGIIEIGVAHFLTDIHLPNIAKRRHILSLVSRGFPERYAEL